MANNSTFSHLPASLGNDLLRHRDIAQSIKDTIDFDLDENNLGTTFGIYGDWGTGKTSVLKMLKELLESSWSQRFRKKIKKYRCKDWYCFLIELILPFPYAMMWMTKTNEYLVVEFDAWYYHKQEELWLALIRKILAESSKQLGWSQALGINLKLYFSRIKGKSGAFHRFALWFFAYLGSVFAILAISWDALAYAYALKDIGRIVFPVTILEFLFHFLINTLSSEIKIKIPPLPKEGFDKGQPIQIDDFLHDYKEIVQSISKKRTLVILIDDLDRCEPEEIIPVLKAIKLLGLNEKIRSNRYDEVGLIFVLAVDRRELSRAVEIAFKGHVEDDELKSFTQSYLDKIVQIPVPLPPLTDTQVESLFGDRNNRDKYDYNDINGQDQSASTDKAITWLMRELPKFVDKNPRRVYQIARAYNLRKRLIDRRIRANILPKEEFPYMDGNNILVLSLLVLQLQWEDIFNAIMKYPAYLFYMCAFATETPILGWVSKAEIDEFYMLGLPIKNTYPVYSSLQDPLIIEMMKAILRRIEKIAQRTSRLNMKTAALARLNTYLTLYENEKEYEWRWARLRVRWENLMSGDPAKIKGKEIELNRLKNHLRGLINSLEVRLDEKQSLLEPTEKSREIERMIKAIGILSSDGGGHQSTFLSEVLTKHGEKSPRNVSRRLLFALGISAESKERKDSIAHQTIYDCIISDGSAAPVAPDASDEFKKDLQIYATPLIENFQLDDTQLEEIYREKFPSANPTLQKILLGHVLLANWGANVIRYLHDEKHKRTINEVLGDVLLSIWKRKVNKPEVSNDKDNVLSLGQKYDQFEQLAFKKNSPDNQKLIKLYWAFVIIKLVDNEQEKDFGIVQEKLRIMFPNTNEEEKKEDKYYNIWQRITERILDPDPRRRWPPFLLSLPNMLKDYFINKEDGTVLPVAGIENMYKRLLDAVQEDKYASIEWFNALKEVEDTVKEFKIAN